MGKTPNSKSKVVDQDVYYAYSKGSAYCSEYGYPKVSCQTSKQKDFKSRGRMVEKLPNANNNNA